MQTKEIPEEVRENQCVKCMGFSEVWGCPYNQLHINKEGRCTFVMIDVSKMPATATNKTL